MIAMSERREGSEGYGSMSPMADADSTGRATDEARPAFPTCGIKKLNGKRDRQ